MTEKEEKQMREYVQMLKTELSYYKNRLQKIDDEDNILVWIPSKLYTCYGGRSLLIKTLQEHNPQRIDGK